MKKVIGAFLILLSCSVHATPDYLEVWFVSAPAKVSQLTSKDNYLAQNTYQCVKVGDNCFDPQIGLYDPKELTDSSVVEIPSIEHEDELEELKEKADPRTDLTTIDFIKKGGHKCDDTNYFDVFCGKPKKNKRNTQYLEVYIDITESMSRLDSKDLRGECYRSSFTRRLKTTCLNTTVYTFNHSRKEIDDPIKACQANNIADDTRLIKWIKGSKARKLVVVTDKTEIGKKFLDFAHSLGAVFKGESKAISMNSLPNKITDFSKICSK